jgi:hypothetical protein
MLYFAYGSNLSLAHLKAFLFSRGVPARHVQKPRLAILPDHRLRTNYFSWVHKAGACNVEPAKNHVVEGIVLKVTNAARWALRIKEGWPRCYEETEIQVVIPSDEAILTAFTFVVSPAHQLKRDQPVSNIYRQLILDGAKTAALSMSYQRSLRRRLKPLPDGQACLQRASTAATA